jgi:hypothetical protein
MVMMSAFLERMGLLKNWTVGEQRAYAPQSFRQAGGMMHRTLRLADMLPMSVSLLSADACILPSWLYANPAVTPMSSAMAASDTSVRRFPLLGVLAPAIVPVCVSAVMIFALGWDECVHSSLFGCCNDVPRALHRKLDGSIHPIGMPDARLNEK